MALVPGGPDTELITGILDGDTADVTFGKWVWVAQCFTLDNLYLAWRVALKLGYYTVLPKYLEYGIRYTAAGKPDGDDMDTTTMLQHPGTTVPGGLWWPQNFPTWPNLNVGEWALVIRVPTADTPWAWYARAAPELPPGITGKAWKSTNSGVDWTEIENHFLLHQVWGTPRVTPIPPPQTVSNWAPLDYKHNPTPTGFQVKPTTDIPTHLWMRYSLTPPRKHKIERYKRGLAMPWNTYYCFDAWKEIEQDEPGDTTEHTFTFNPWPYCQTRWFYFTGTKRLYPTPSASPIYELHRTELEEVRYAWSRVFSRTGSIRTVAAAYKHAPTFQIGDTPTSSATFLLFTRNHNSVVVDVSLSLVDPDGKPLDSYLAHDIINLSAGVFDERSDPANPVYIHTVTIPYTYETDTQYALVQQTLSGTAEWWLRFRIYGWVGDRDEGEENHVTYHATHPLYPEWTKVSPYRQTYEAYGYQ